MFLSSRWSLRTVQIHVPAGAASFSSCCSQNTRQGRERLERGPEERRSTNGHDLVELICSSLWWVMDSDNPSVGDCH